MKKTLALAAALTLGLPAHAIEYSVVGLGFENMQVLDEGIYTPAQVWNFYNGGYSRNQLGTQDLVLGPDNYAVAFNASALALRSTAADGDGNFGPRYLNSPPPPDDPLTNLGVSALFFTVNDPVLNYGQGFNNGFSFYYASSAAISVTLYDGVDGGGSVLGADTFQSTPACTFVDNTYCAWSIGAVTFAGTARSVKFDGLENQALFDNVTFGSVTPIDGAVPIPEPSTYALLALGLLGIGFAARRRAA